MLFQPQMIIMLKVKGELIPVLKSLIQDHSAKFRDIFKDNKVVIDLDELVEGLHIQGHKLDKATITPEFVRGYVNLIYTMHFETNTTAIFFRSFGSESRIGALSILAVTYKFSLRVSKNLVVAANAESAAIWILRRVVIDLKHRPWDLEHLSQAYKDWVGTGTLTRVPEKIAGKIVDFFCRTGWETKPPAFLEAVGEESSRAVVSAPACGYD
ncbi:hypothetical protein GGR56DRAFT_617288 [Xylariaceae sp. FL0804]|nr:hypothetical protein GGR56DRAFT_617288 [Xylariaceae sp. FL0804]